MKTTASTAATGKVAPRAPNEEGSISSIFASLNGEAPIDLPPRFSALKQEIWRDDMVQTWREVLEELETATEEVSRRGSDVSLQYLKPGKYAESLVDDSSHQLCGSFEWAFRKSSCEREGYGHSHCDRRGTERCN